ncbi:MAG: sulfatase-like hydrolase/transferase [Microthrixaceae bacterium]|nr:sulfatase-like hydrolase/transferase [Microthrixaceae bacterium]
MPTSPSSCTWRRRRDTRRTWCRWSGPTATRGCSTRATRRSATGSSLDRIELGLIPQGTQLSTINPHGEPGRTGPDGRPWPQLDTVRPWDTLTADEQKLFTRMAEVFAGYISYYDDRLGRVLDFLEESGELDNTLIVVTSDNGASGEGGPNGSFNEWRFFNGVPDTFETTNPHIDELGTRRRTTTTTPDGRGHSTRRSRTGSAGPAPRVGCRTCAWCPGPPASRPTTPLGPSTSTRWTSCRRSMSCWTSSHPR